MSIARFRGYFTPICDICGEELPAETSFLDAVSAKKAAGWKTQWVDGCYEDTCRTCQNGGEDSD